MAIRLPDILLLVGKKRITTRKPFDFCACNHKGYFVAVEAKATRSDTFSFSRIEDHQAEALKLVAGTEYGKAFLALNFRGQKSVGEAYMIPWGWFGDFITKWHKKSIKKKEAKEQFWRFSLTRISGGWERRGNFFSRT